MISLTRCQPYGNIEGMDPWIITQYNEILDRELHPILTEVLFSILFLLGQWGRGRGFKHETVSLLFKSCCSLGTLGTFL
jgi:hypothetical protein